MQIANREPKNAKAELNDQKPSVNKAKMQVANREPKNAKAE